jgi:hypoxanthine-guanine phosphoribosyltransferase
VKLKGEPTLTLGTELVTVTVYARGPPVTLTRKVATAAVAETTAPDVLVVEDITGDGESMIVRVSV